jgi:hypothetical protein
MAVKGSTAKSSENSVSHAQLRFLNRNRKAALIHEQRQSLFAKKPDDAKDAVEIHPVATAREALKLALSWASTRPDSSVCVFASHPTRSFRSRGSRHWAKQNGGRFLSQAFRGAPPPPICCRPDGAEITAGRVTLSGR